jgi:nucleoside-diphosphate-sugar epimerase
MRVLITGATGFIGRHLAPYLVRQGTAVTLLLRETYAGQPLPAELQALRAQVDVVYADLRQFNLTVRALRTAAPEQVIHLAAAGVTDPFLAVDTAVRHNVSGSLNLLRACFENSFSVNQFIMARTPGERSALNTYAASKAAAWNFAAMYARTHSWPISGAMIFQAYGPGQAAHTLVTAAANAARAGQDFALTAGAQKRDWIYVVDVVTGLANMLSRTLPPGSTLELGTGQATAVADVVRLIYQIAGKGGQPLVGALPGRPGEEPLQVAEVEATRSLLAWRPVISLKEGLGLLLGEA